MGTVDKKVIEGNDVSPIRTILSVIRDRRKNYRENNRRC